VNRRQILLLTSASALSFFAQSGFAEQENYFDSDEYRERVLSVISTEFEDGGDLFGITQDIGGAAPVTPYIEGEPFAAPSIITQYSARPSFRIPPLSDDQIAQILNNSYWARPDNSSPRQAQAGSSLPEWPSAREASDYAHIHDIMRGEVYVQAGFMLTADDLSFLADRNRFSLRDRRPVVLFGLRGCRIADGSEFRDFAEQQELVVDVPNHLDPNCVIGVWRRHDRTLAVFQGSTVPAVDYIHRFLPQMGLGASLLPTGLYDYAAGTHRPSRPRSIQRGALRIHGTYTVLRTAEKLSYNPWSWSTAWTQGQHHNIHATGDWDYFDSAGCQVIKGKYAGADRLYADGNWRRFQEAAGLVDQNGIAIPPDTRPTFQYMLLTGDEARQASRRVYSFTSEYHVLRPGSRGPDVRKKQAEIAALLGDRVDGLVADGHFGMQTTFAALLEKKETVGEFTSPVILLPPN